MINSSAITYFRALRHEDVAQLYQFYLQAPLMLYSRRIFLEDWLHDVVDDENQMRFAIKDESEKLIGGATLWPTKELDVWSPTIWIDRLSQGQGHATRALNFLINVARNNSIRKIVAGVYAYNGASIALARRAFGSHTLILNTGEWDMQLIYEADPKQIGK